MSKIEMIARRNQKLERTSRNRYRPYSGRSASQRIVTVTSASVIGIRVQSMRWDPEASSALHQIYPVYYPHRVSVCFHNYNQNFPRRPAAINFTKTTVSDLFQYTVLSPPPLLLHSQAPILFCKIYYKGIWIQITPPPVAQIL